MAMLKAQKVEYVKRLREELKGYKVYAIMPIEKVPDRLVQRVKNQLKPDAKVVIARKSLLLRVLGEDSRLKGLEQYVNGNIALILSKKDPFELNRIIAANKAKMGAKPNQISPGDINIEGGETTIAPGQAVTDLKAAGIDVQIQKGKVVISKGKTLVRKGAKITTEVSKALKLLDIMPFEAGTKLAAVLDGSLIYTERALGIDESFIKGEILADFGAAHMLSIEIRYVTPYNAELFVRNAYIGALGLGLKAKIYEPDVVEQLLAQAVREAMSLPKEQAAAARQEQRQEPAPQDGGGKDDAKQ